MPRLRPIALLIVVCGLVLPPLAAVEDYHGRDRRPVQAELKPLIKQKQEEAARKIAQYLEQQDAEGANLAVVVLAQSAQGKKLPLIGAIADHLLEKGDTASVILAADVLLKSIETAGRKIDDYPHDLCAGLAVLLDHEDPVVQAMAEWGLTLRVKHHNMQEQVYKRLCDFDEPWFKRWQLRRTENLLDNDYGRQLVNINLHRDLPSLQQAIQTLDGRMSAMLEAARSTVVRVPVYLPSPWTPADTNPSFYNTVDSDYVPTLE